MAIPGPRNGLIGWSTYQQIRDDFLRFSVEIARRYGDRVYYRLGSVRFFQFTHPDDYHNILVTQAKRVRKTKRTKDVLRRWNGNGLVLNDGESWSRQRRLVQPAFHPHRVPGYSELVVRHARELVQRCSNREIDVAKELGRLTFVTTAEALFGAEIEDRVNPFLDAVETLQQIGFTDFTAPMVWPLWLPLPSRRRLKAAIGYVRGLIDELIADRRASGVDRGDLLSTLLLAVDDEGDGKGMTDLQARDESVNLLLGGNETTATAITWAAYLLARHPEVQEEVRTEVHRAFDEVEESAAVLSKLPLTEMVFKEAMRLYPSAYALSREAADDLEIGGERIPQGAQLILIPYVTHRDSRWFDEPNDFCPRRFERDSDFMRCSYIPFGAGPRACIGKGFAMMEGMLVLATLVRNHRLELLSPEEPEIEAQISLHPRGGLKIRLTHLGSPTP
jgi:cytochrome P450